MIFNLVAQKAVATQCWGVARPLWIPDSVQSVCLDWYGPYGFMISKQAR